MLLSSADQSKLTLLTQLKYERAALDFQWAMLKLGMALDRWLDHAYNPDQPRVPAGHPDGGQWTDGNDTGAPTTPTVTVHSRTRITIHYPDGSRQTRIDGSRSWRNNNPGNIKVGNFTNRHGAIGNNHGFAIFPDEKTGQAASVALLKTSTYGNLTVDEAIKRRSPPEENDTPKIQDAIRRIGRFSGEEIIGELDQEELDRLVSAIRRTEGWIEGIVFEMPAP
ncbi:MAG: hypothetical protein ABL951_07410 [Alphaproteobacteria bacterium]